MTALRRFSIWVDTRDVDVMEHIPEASLDAFRSDLLCVTELVRSRGAEPVLLTHATYFGSEIEPEDEEMMLAWRRFYPELSEAGFIDLEKRANDAIRSIGHDAGVNVVDSARLIPRGPKYFADFVHFTDLGAARMATLIAEQISATQALRVIRWSARLHGRQLRQGSTEPSRPMSWSGPKPPSHRRRRLDSFSSAASICTRNSGVVRAMRTHSRNRAISGLGVATTGRPVARYSLNFSGLAWRVCWLSR